MEIILTDVMLSFLLLALSMGLQISNSSIPSHLSVSKPLVLFRLSASSQ